STRTNAGPPFSGPPEARTPPPPPAASIAVVSSAAGKATAISFRITRTSDPAAPPVAHNRDVLLQDAAQLFECRPAPVIVELAVIERRRDERHLRRLLEPHDERAAHVIR